MNDYNSFNQVILVGRIGSDPELKKSKGKKPQYFVRFSIATYQKYASGTKITTWTQCSYWGEKSAKWAAEYVKKGMMILVKGRLDTRSWTDINGQKKSITDVKANEMVFMGPASMIKMDNKEELAAQDAGEDIPYMEEEVTEEESKGTTEEDEDLF